MITVLKSDISTHNQRIYDLQADNKDLKDRLIKLIIEYDEHFRYLKRDNLLSTGISATAAEIAVAAFGQPTFSESPDSIFQSQLLGC